MMMDMFAYYNMLKDNDINIVYTGPIWAEGVEGIGQTLKKRLEFDEAPLSAAQSVFSVFVEQMNNMLMYSSDKKKFVLSDEKNVDVPRGMFVLGVKGKKYFVQSGNIMKNENIEPIKNKIDYLNTLDKPRLRKLYMEQIKNGDISEDSRGAGLGLIEIARRASTKIEYDFKPVDEATAFFTMLVTIG